LMILVSPVRFGVEGLFSLVTEDGLLFGGVQGDGSCIAIR